MNIKIMYHSDIPRLTKTDNGDWIDLFTAEDIILKAGGFKLINLGISVELPEGYEAHVIPRSSTFIKWGLIQANSFGLIDQSYKGRDDIWYFPAYAVKDTCIPFGTRLCQFRIMEKMAAVELVEVDNLDSGNRGGFGSSGV